LTNFEKVLIWLFEFSCSFTFTTRGSMKMPSCIKAFALAVALFSSSVVASPLAAQEVTLSGTATGRFVSNGGGFTVGQGCTTLLVGLQYCGSTFSDQTSFGFLGLGGNASPGTNHNNFGSFLLSNSLAHNYTGQQFELMLTIASPTGITPGGPSQLFSSLIRGSVSSSATGGIFIDFDNTARLFAFTGSSDLLSMSGNGSLVVNDMSLNAGQLGAATGYFEASNLRVVPEPSTYALMSAGLLGVFGVARRRRNA
jgi:hypothetical protein